MKWLPLLVFSMGMYKGKGYFQSLFEVSAASVAQIEMQSISQIITLNMVSDDLPTAENFSEYLRKNMRVKSGDVKRDVANDLWGTPYKLERAKGKFIVKSAGPDKNFGSSDDLTVSVSDTY